MNQQLFGLGGGITKEGAEITGTWLPTNKQVIRCYLFHGQEGTSEPPTGQKDYAKIVHEKFVPFYLKGNIPMASAKRGCEKISEILEKNVKLSETSVVTDVLCNYCTQFLCHSNNLKQPGW